MTDNTVDTPREPRFRPARTGPGPTLNMSVSPAALEVSDKPVRLGGEDVHVPAGGSTDGEHVFLTVKELPSGFKAYQKGVVITYRPYTWAEINYFSNSKVGTAETYTLMLQGIECQGIESSELTLMDFYYVCLLRKLSTLGTPQFQLLYEAFGLPQTSVISYEQVEFDDLEVDLPAVTKIGGVRCEFMPISVGGYLELLAEGNADEDIPVMAMCVRNMAYADSLPLLQAATGRDLMALNLIDDKFYHSIKPVKVWANKEVANPDFNPDLDEGPDNLQYTRERKEIVVNLDSPETMIMPFRGDGDADGDLVSFGV